MPSIYKYHKSPCGAVYPTEDNTQNQWCKTLNLFKHYRRPWSVFCRFIEKLKGERARLFGGLARPQTGGGADPVRLVGSRVSVCEPHAACPPQQRGRAPSL